MSESIDTEPKEPKHRPRKGFLYLATLTVAGAVAAYIYQDEIIFYGGQENHMAFVTLLIALVVFSMFFVLCYRNPKLGDRLLDRGKKLDAPLKDGTTYHYSAGFKTASGADEKQLNSARKHRRATRRQLAEVTRQMQADAAEKKHED